MSGADTRPHKLSGILGEGRGKARGVTGGMLISLSSRFSKHRLRLGGCFIHIGDTYFSCIANVMATSASDEMVKSASGPRRSTRLRYAFFDTTSASW